jgi:hypothetical protein
MKTVIIDQNVRLPFNDVTVTYVGFDDVIGETLPALGEKVTVMDIQRGDRAPGRIASIDIITKSMFVAVEWALLDVKHPV